MSVCRVYGQRSVDDDTAGFLDHPLRLGVGIVDGHRDVVDRLAVGIGFVYRGELTFTIEEDTVTIGPGDTYILYSHETHAAENTGDIPVEGVDVFCPPRGAADWME
ncbi:hypothetical protein CV102_13915 [Natronococcus pandeyae]|uniref:Cupin type-2 domain-containing protein n=1 Tax=Natronococcus pandeyae TaxID=2055836 RepID=A0A8J8Q3D0_9EURY|nr:hypothetical protein CV102_13915 [Natronococcus pandeyae]